MLRSVAAAVSVGFVLSPLALWAQNSGTRTIPGGGGGNAGARQPPGGGNNGNAGARTVPGGAGTNAGARTVPGGNNAGARTVPNGAQPGNAGARQLPGQKPPYTIGGVGGGSGLSPGSFGGVDGNFLGDGGGFNSGGAIIGGGAVNPGRGIFPIGGFNAGNGFNPIVGEIQSGVVFPVMGGAAFVGTRQPFVLNAPAVGGGPVFIQQPRFFEASVSGGVGGLAQSGGMIAGGGNLFASGIAIGITGRGRIGGNGGFFDVQAGARQGGVGAGGARLSGRIGGFGFNATGLQGAAGARNLMVIPAVGGPVVIGGDPGANMFNIVPGIGVDGAPGAAVGAAGAAGPLVADDAPRAAAPVAYWLGEMWKAPTTVTFLAGRDEAARRKLFDAAAELLSASLGDGRPAKLPDNTSVQLVRPTFMVFTAPDGKSTTGWIRGQEMPDEFQAVALHFLRAADGTK